MRLLIISSYNSTISEAAKVAMDKGAEVAFVNTTEQAIKDLLAGKGAELIMVDVSYDIQKLIAELKRHHINITCVACGIQTNTAKAVEAIKAGASEYIPLPPDPDMIAAIISSASQNESEIIFQDLSMQKMIAFARKIAPSEASVLITGESGVGKEVMARFIHKNSRRSKEKFISINCAAIPENLLESELFGHEKGAFTGATATRVGKFEEANNGTLLLDEISEMDVRLQAKLLRVIQERVIDRIGGKDPINVNIRIIATANRDLNQCINEGTFREDLLFRLNVINLNVPNLNERPADIPCLANYFIEKYAKANGVNTPQITERAMHNLTQWKWKGNVRELENTIHRAVLINEGDVIDETSLLTPDGYPLMHNVTHDAASTDTEQEQHKHPSSFVGQRVADVERTLILGTLDHCVGNRTHAAQILGISIRTLRNKLNQYREEGLDIAPSRISA